MKATITIDVNTDSLRSISDAQLAQLFHAVNADNTTPVHDKTTAEVADELRVEIVRRWLTRTAPDVYGPSMAAHFWSILKDHGRWVNGEWMPFSADLSS